MGRFRHRLVDRLGLRRRGRGRLGRRRRRDAAQRARHAGLLAAASRRGVAAEAVARLDQVEHRVEGGVRQADLAGLRHALERDAAALVGRVGGDLGAEPRRCREAVGLVGVVERHRHHVDGAGGDVAVDQGVAAVAERHLGAVVGGAAGADVEERVAVGTGHLGALLGGGGAVGGDEDEVALAAVDAHERGSARLGREVAFGDAGGAALLADQADQRRRDLETSYEGHTLNSTGVAASTTAIGVNSRVSAQRDDGIKAGTVMLRNY